MLAITTIGESARCQLDSSHGHHAECSKVVPKLQSLTVRIAEAEGCGVQLRGCSKVRDILSGRFCNCTAITALERSSIPYMQAFTHSATYVDQAKFGTIA